jgi:hypothetical protein
MFINILKHVLFMWVRIYNVWNVVLKKDGADQLDRSCEKWRSITQSEGGEEYRTYSKKKEG